MVKQNVTLTIEEQTWAEFRKLMIDRKQTASDQVETFMQKEVLESGATED